MRCRVCHGDAFGPIIDLGSMPLVNTLGVRADEPAPTWPLTAVYCRQCSHGQLTETPPPSAMFSDYCYYSSQSTTMVRHAARLVDRFVRAGERVVEVASNDGYLLAHAARRTPNILGIEPAANVARVARAAGVPTLVAFFDEGTARDVVRRRGSADVVFANNVLGHVPDPNPFVAGLRTLLADDGTAHVEVPHLMKLIEYGAFDTIYHEHASYFTARSLRTLFNQHGLRIVDVETLDLHGGSLHLQIRHQGDQRAVDAVCDAEVSYGLTDGSAYAGFDARVQRLRRDVTTTLDRFDRVAAYGAAAKGVVMLNTFGLGRDRIEWVADVSPHKQGRFVPGTGQRIVPPLRLEFERPDACVLLPWNLRAEIVARQSAYLDGGGRFIVPLPTLDQITRRGADPGELSTRRVRPGAVPASPATT